MRLNQLKEELTKHQDLGESLISIHSFQVAVNELEILTQAFESMQQAFTEQYEAVVQDARKIESERDAIVELHKQVIREVINASPNQETEDRGPDIQQDQ